MIFIDRLILKKLAHWKVRPDRKPLVIKGARQVGKTWLMKEFGRLYYKNLVYINFDADNDIKEIFELTKDPNRIINNLSMLRNTKIEPNDTLIVFDEVQECTAALNSLKYFNEEANKYHIIAAGSLLGTLLAERQSYPVGKVNILHVYPMTFEEYLMATDEGLWKFYSGFTAESLLPDVFHNKLLEAYRFYLIIGGMPECIDTWQKTHDPILVQEKQSELLELYENDIGKHNKKIMAGRILMVLRSIAPQLGKNNEKFVYGAMKPGARAREFEEAIEWLVSSGLAYRINNVSKPEHPLPVYDKFDSFKLYFFDIGLLKMMAGVDNGAIILNQPFQFRGVLSENFVYQQVISQLNVAPRYFSPSTNIEIDFVFQCGTQIIPIEVKSGLAVHSPSFNKYIANYKPEKAIKFSLNKYKQDGHMVNIPIYFAGKTELYL